MRRSLVLLALVNAFACAVLPARAQAPSYPAKPVRAIVPTPPAGPLDIVARLVGDRLSAKLGQPFIIENRAGAFGNVGAELVAKAAPDGYTLLWVVDATMTANPSLYKLNFDPERDFAPIAMVTESGSALVVHPSIAAASIKDLIVIAKKQPLAYASGGNGSPGHLLGEQFQAVTGVAMTHVPYNGNAPAVQSIVSGQTQVFFSSIPGVLPHVRSGKLKALAVTQPRRSPYMPDMPTLPEMGLDMATTSWFGLYAPARTPEPILDLLYREVAEAVNAPEMQDKLKAQGLDPVVAPADALRARVRSDASRWAKVVREAKIKLD
jgi:tripartite-type tricarboxylate transporter receptor subunit TctC